MLPVSLAPLGRNALIGWLVSGVGVLCIVFAMARLSRLGGDGIQANIEREFGPTVAFLVAWAFWVSNWVAQASVAVGAASALSFVGPSSADRIWIVPVAIGFVVLLTAINAIGVRAAGGLFGRDGGNQDIAAAGGDLVCSWSAARAELVTNRSRQFRSASPMSPPPPR